MVSGTRRGRTRRRQAPSRVVGASTKVPEDGGSHGPVGVVQYDDQGLLDVRSPTTTDRPQRSSRDRTGSGV